MAKYHNPAIKGFDEYGSPIGDSAAILFYDQQHIMRENVYPNKKELKQSTTSDKKLGKFNSKEVALVRGDMHRNPEFVYANGSVYRPSRKVYSSAERQSYKNGFKRGFGVGINKKKGR